MINIQITYLEFIKWGISIIIFIIGLWLSMKILYGASKETIQELKRLREETEKSWNQTKLNDK